MTPGAKAASEIHCGSAIHCEETAEIVNVATGKGKGAFSWAKYQEQ